MKTAATAKVNIQAELGIAEHLRTPNIGPVTRRAFELLAIAPNDEPWPPLASVPLPTLSARNINAHGLELVKHFEGCYNTAYKDSGGVWTIGIGHTGLTHEDGTVFPGRVISNDEALQLLDYDMNQSEAAVQAIAKVELTDDQFSALVSWHFNTGGPRTATLWKRLNAGDYEGAGDQLLEWDKDNGKRIAGLTRRRYSENRLFHSVPNFIISVDEFKSLKARGVIV